MVALLRMVGAILPRKDRPVPPGEHVFNAFLENKKIERDKYRTQVTDYEIKRYLPVL